MLVSVRWVEATFSQPRPQSYEQFTSLYLQGYYLYSQVMAKFQPFETFFPRIYEEILQRFGTCEKDLGTFLVGLGSGSCYQHVYLNSAKVERMTNPEGYRNLYL